MQCIYRLTGLPLPESSASASAVWCSSILYYSFDAVVGKPPLKKNAPRSPQGGACYLPSTTYHLKLKKGRNPRESVLLYLFCVLQRGELGKYSRFSQVGKFSRKVGCGKFGRGHEPTVELYLRGSWEYSEDVGRKFAGFPLPSFRDSPFCTRYPRGYSLS
jgi:hypothetical protein